MDKAERIRDDCRVLMAAEDGPTKAGYAITLVHVYMRLSCVEYRVDILTTTSGYLEQAYDKIFRWCSFEFRQMGRDALLEVDPSMREAVRRLRRRPELLAYARRSLLPRYITLRIFLVKRLMYCPKPAKRPY